jgi:GNAT superfamily N-acetyltransferase
MTDSAVRQLREDEIGHAVAMLSRAFQDAPLPRFLTPDPARRVEVSRWLFASIVRYGLLYGDVWAAVGADGAAQGVAIWWAPEYVTPDDDRAARVGFTAAPAALDPDGRTRLTELGSHTARLHQGVAPDRHWYLALLGVEPALQGHGIAGEVLRPMLNRLDSESLPAYLETGQPRNVTYYPRHGFQAVAEVTLPSTGLTFWGMRRDPPGVAAARPASAPGHDNDAGSPEKPLHR